MKKTVSLLLAVIMLLSMLPMSFAFAADLGDVTGDGKINSRDIASLQRFIAGSATPTDEQKLAADITGDGKVNSRDIASLQKHISGVSTITPSTPKPTETQAPAGDGIITISELAQAAKAALASYTTGTPFYTDGITVDGVKVAQQNYYYIAAQAIQDIYNGKTTATYDSSKIKMSAPSILANYTFEYSEVNKNFYMNFAIRQTIYADANGRIGASAGYPTNDNNANGFPVTDFEGQFNYEAGLLMFTRILASYADTGVLPETVKVEAVPADENAATNPPATDTPATQAPAAPDVLPTEAPAFSTDLKSGTSTFTVEAIAKAADTILSHYEKFSAYAPAYSMAKAVEISDGGKTYCISDDAWAYMAGSAIAGISGTCDASGLSGYTASTKVTYQAVSKPTANANAEYNEAELAIDKVVDMAWKSTNDANNNSYVMPASNSSTLGVQVSYNSIVLATARALSHYAANGTLPTTVKYDKVAYSADDDTSAAPTPQITSGAPVSGTLSIAEIVDGIALAYAEFEETDKFPETLTIGSAKDMNQGTYFAVAAKAVMAINKNSTADIGLKNYKNPEHPARFDLFDSSTISKAAYLYIADKQVAFANNNGAFANYVTFPGTSNTSYNGTCNFAANLAIIARALVAYKETGKLPETVSSWSSSYLAPTKNCESDDATIVATAQEVTKGATDDEAKAKALFTYVQNAIKYDYYANTLRSATKVHADKIANCCDHAHYTIALARAVGIPARYAHIEGYWGSSLEGHVYAELFINGEWVCCDTSMDKNSYGNHESWELKSLLAHYSELYF